MNNRRSADLRYLETPRGKYSRHRANAKRRGVSFTLTFEEWWSVWATSRRWPHRGNTRNKYCMARNGDVGGYDPGNVRIAKWTRNTAERNRTVRKKRAAEGEIRIKSTVYGGDEAPF